MQWCVSNQTPLFFTKRVESVLRDHVTNGIHSARDQVKVIYINKQIKKSNRVIMDFSEFSPARLMFSVMSLSSSPDAFGLYQQTSHRILHKNFKPILWASSESVQLWHRRDLIKKWHNTRQYRDSRSFMLTVSCFCRTGFDVCRYPITPSCVQVSDGMRFWWRILRFCGIWL